VAQQRAYLACLRVVTELPDNTASEHISNEARLVNNQIFTAVLTNDCGEDILAFTCRYVPTHGMGSGHLPVSFYANIWQQFSHCFLSSNHNLSKIEAVNVCTVLAAIQNVALLRLPSVPLFFLVFTYCFHLGRTLKEGGRL
jgi:hypothetical protein